MSVMSESYAKLLAHSSYDGNQIASFEVNLPKVLLAELNTHRKLSRNYSSSRAIPNSRFIEIDSFEPTQYLKNKSGMVASNEALIGTELSIAKKTWQMAIDMCKYASTQLTSVGLHKQWANRPNDWHVMAKGVVTATDFNNLFWLRDHTDAQPEIRDLIVSMQDELRTSTPVELLAGEWHLPYVTSVRGKIGLEYFDETYTEIDIESARRLSASCCAQASYRKLDTSSEKADDIFKKLLESDRVHASPAEHQATPIVYPKQQFLWNPINWSEGITHITRAGELCSGNLTHWIQFRQLIPNNAVYG